MSLRPAAPGPALGTGPLIPDVLARHPARLGMTAPPRLACSTAVAVAVPPVLMARPAVASSPLLRPDFLALIQIGGQLQADVGRGLGCCASEIDEAPHNIAKAREKDDLRIMFSS